jgi:hypothetical protein
MLAFLFLLLVLPIVAGAIASLVARRALPLLGAGAGAWLTWFEASQVSVTMLAGLCAVAVIAFALDRLVEGEATRRFVMGAEACAGALLAMLAAFAVFGSGGVEGAALWIAIGVSGLAATTTSLGFRLDAQY